MINAEGPRPCMKLILISKYRSEHVHLTGGIWVKAGLGCQWLAQNSKNIKVILWFLLAQDISITTHYLRTLRWPESNGSGLQRDPIVNEHPVRVHVCGP